MTLKSNRIATAKKNGKSYFALTNAGETMPIYLFDSMLDCGMVQIIAYGSENLYFRWTDDAGFEQNGYCKAL